MPSQSQHEKALSQQLHIQDALDIKAPNDTLSALENVPCTEAYSPQENCEDQQNASLPDSSDCQHSSQVSSTANGSVRGKPPKIAALVVQCARCFKWRFVPSKRQYEAIRQHLLEDPWVCEKACFWNQIISCDDPPDIEQDDTDDTIIWAIDKPNISATPPGWDRLISIRSEGSAKFADIYYITPTQKKLRSLVEIERFLTEHPEYTKGVELSQFSFQSPKPLRKDYVRKRPKRFKPNEDQCGFDRLQSCGQL
eukprot:TRINITY_DN5472_c0_g1_i1.p1 TRINITY_DN5472_c0_g1~~TRINITY_DN5472_c0_g1_i1.p1  ORF type:complete len:253 (+),score=37.90 TRINITY_DN5472_c0_g1_i1:775-1533(+)